jgi:hypothetical protein
MKNDYAGESYARQSTSICGGLENGMASSGVNTAESTLKPCLSS